jgi:hypothetical protein
MVIFLIVNLIGCEAFVRKFTRKPKKDKVPEELVLAPEEYKPPARTPEELYRGYFLFWKSWHDELINALAQESTSQKKRIDCAQEALKSLSSMRDMLDDPTQKKLNKYVIQLQDLRDFLKQDFYGSSYSRYYQSAERIRLCIIKDFSFVKIKDNIK